MVSFFDRDATLETTTMRPIERLDHILMDHAAGNLRGDIAFVVDAHLAMNAQSREVFQQLEVVGGGLLDRLEPSALSAGVDAGLIMGSDAGKTAQGATAASSCLVTSISQGQWCKGLAGFMTKPIAGTGARLLRLEAGRSAPAHTHRGLELTLVLHGTLEDGDTQFQRGDLVVHDEESTHQPRAGAGGDCICLIADEAPVRLIGPLAWAINPFIGKAYQ
jgi:putative transcriptional regulator